MRQSLFSKTQPLTCQPIDLVKGPSRLGRVARAQTVRPCSFLRSEAHQINGLETVFLRRKVAKPEGLCLSKIRSTHLWMRTSALRYSVAGEAVAQEVGE